MMLLLLFFFTAHADVYMHNPRGANDRNCEKNVNRNNGNLLYDTQNNAKGGYACPRAIAGSNANYPTKGVSPRMEFEAGSELEVEWTAQHGCGNPQEASPNQGVTASATGRNTQNVHCEMVLDLACASTLDPVNQYGEFSSFTNTAYGPKYLAVPREGLPNNDNDAATNRISTTDPGQAAGAAGTSNNLRFGVHETPEWYNACNRVERNKGLFTADQNVNRRSAIGTRQNPNGGRRGLECPEERDYYPYWRPSPFVPQAYLVDDPGRCGSTQTLPCGGAGTPCAGTVNKGDWVGNQEGFNAAGRAGDVTASQWLGSCVMTNLAAVNGVAIKRVPKTNNEATNGATNNDARNAYNGRRWPNNAAACNALKATQPNLEWADQMIGPGFAAKVTGNLAAPTTRAEAMQALMADGPMCNVVDYSRSNHLGNSGTDDTATRVTWTIPNVNALNVPANANGATVSGKGEPCILRLRYNMSSSDYKRNTTSAMNQKNGVKSPIQQDPLVKIGPGSRDNLQLALNTNQVARTFQDRSYVFYIKPADPANNGFKVLNINVRGKRGNIVQTYPSVEYDFIPNNKVVTPQTKLAFQWVGSDYNPRRGCNDGEGGPYRGDRNVGNGLTANTQGSNQNSRMDRMNLVAVADSIKNYPNNGAANQNNGLAMNVRVANTNPNGLFANVAQARKFAFGNAEENLVAFNTQTGQNLQCLTATEINNINNENRRENHPRNCAEANALIPHFPTEMIEAGAVGSQYKLYSTRNNNFSNRDVKVQWEVQLSTTTVPPNTLPAEFIVSASALATTDVIADNCTDDGTEAMCEADVPGFDPIENDDYGEGAKEGCTQDMLTFSNAPVSASSITAMFAVVFFTLYTLL